MPESSTRTKVKGRTTFRIASILFLLSVVLSLVGISSAVALLGAYRGGLVAALYHLFYAAMYLALGIGLWRASHWCYRLVFAATLIYTLDKLQYIIYRESLQVEMMRYISDALMELMRYAGPYLELMQTIDQQKLQQMSQMLMQSSILVSTLFAACWWGFAVYTYFRRDYFRPSNTN